MLPVPIGAVEVPLLKGALVATKEVDGVDSTWTWAEVAPTVTVTVLADVTVTVAGPHSPLPPVAPRGEALTPDSPGPAGASEETMSL